MATRHRNQAVGWWNPSGWISDAIVRFLVMSWRKRLVCALGIAGAVVLAGHLCGAVSFGLRNPSKGLPVSVGERARLFGQAWAAQDQSGMMRFVRPPDEAMLRAWTAANPVPAAIADAPRSDRKIKTIFVQRDDADGAVVKVQISDRAVRPHGPEASGGTASSGTASSGMGATGFVQRQMWSFSGGNWYFSPEASPAATAERTAAAYPTSPPMGPLTNSRPAPVNSNQTNTPTRAPASSNVVVPTTVPPWARAR
jgi:hypothetical protein